MSPPQLAAGSFLIAMQAEFRKCRRRCVMVEVIALLRKRADLSRDQFIDYYENNHAPLIKELTPEIIGYERLFLRDDASAIVAPGMPYPDFDVVTRISFADEAGYVQAMERYAQPDIAERIAADEENVFDRRFTRFFRVDRRSSF